MNLPLFRSIAALVLMAGGLLGSAQADERAGATPDAGRPKVALVLSGGGALGISHVGVIQELEARGIRPDMVVGTSMGAVIGGLYAAGLDGAELEKVVTSVDWPGIFNPSADRNDLTYRQKQQQADFPGTASLGVSDTGVILPTGAISDQVLIQELRRFTPALARLDSFDDLAIPFRAVATDIATGEAVVLSSGDLPMAMRASLSLPGIFPAVRIDGRLLVDGGLAANIPISVAREMGADIVIAVWTPNDLLPEEKIASVLDVVAQTVSLLILANERAELSTLTERDILIKTDTGTIGAAAFTKGTELIAAGRAAFLEHESQLASRLPASPPVMLAAPKDTRPPVINFLRIENGSRLNQSLIEAKLASLLGQPADPAIITPALDAVYALGPFERVDYLLEVQDGQTGLVVRAEDAVPDAGRVRLGLSIANDFNTESDAAISIDYRSAALDAYGSEIQAQATLGDFNAVSLEYFRLLEPTQRWFASARAEIENRPINVFSTRGFKTASYDIAVGRVGFDAGYQFGNVGEVRIGTEFGTGRAKLNTGSATLSEIDIEIGRIIASAGFDTLDDPFFPRTGYRASTRWTNGLTGLGDNANYQTLSLDWLGAFSRERDTLIAAIAGGDSIQGRPPVESLFRVGGLFNLSGYRQQELSGDSFFTTQLVYRRQLGGSADRIFGVPLYAGGSLEGGDVWTAGDSIDPFDVRVGGSVFVGANTALGPVYLAFGRSEGGRQSAYLLIGRPF